MINIVLERITSDIIKLSHSFQVTSNTAAARHDQEKLARPLAAGSVALWPIINYLLSQTSLVQGEGCVSGLL